MIAFIDQEADEKAEEIEVKVMILRLFFINHIINYSHCIMSFMIYIIYLI